MSKKFKIFLCIILPIILIVLYIDHRIEKQSKVLENVSRALSEMTHGSPSVIEMNYGELGKHMHIVYEETKVISKNNNDFEERIKFSQTHNSYRRVLYKITVDPSKYFFYKTGNMIYYVYGIMNKTEDTYRFTDMKNIRIISMFKYKKISDNISDKDIQNKLDSGVINCGFMNNKIIANRWFLFGSMYKIDTNKFEVALKKAFNARVFADKDSKMGIKIRI